MRLPFGSSVALALSTVALASAAAAGCTGDDPSPCGAACADGGAPSATGFEVSAAPEIALVAGTVGEVEINVTRAGYDGAIVVSAEGLPANVSAGALTIAPGATSGKLTLTALPAAAHGKRSVTLVATDVEAKTRRERPAALLVRGAPGAIDNSFGEGGRAEIPGGAAGLTLAALVVQADGKLVVAGSSQKSFAAARLDADGKVDAAFGTAGRAIGNLRTEDTSDELVGGAALGPGGKIVVGGYGLSPPSPSEYQLARFDAAGKLDTTFDADGMWAKPPLEADWGIEIDAKGVAVQADGRVFLGGFGTQNKNGTFVRRAVIARLTDGGALDNTFGGGDGWIEKQVAPNDDGTLASSDQCNALAVVSGEKIVCAGTSALLGRKTFLVWRSNPDGGPDNTFGGDGTSPIRAQGSAGVAGEARDVHDLSDGKLVVTGEDGTTAVVVRLDAQGRTDASFAGAGVFSVASLGSAIAPRSAVNAKGDVLVTTTSASGQELAVARVLASGAADAAFGENGRVVVKLTDAAVIGSARVAVQADGRVVVAAAISGKGVALYRLWN